MLKLLHLLEIQLLRALTVVQTGHILLLRFMHTVNRVLKVHKAELVSRVFRGSKA